VVARRCSRTRALVTCFSGGRLAVERGRPGGVAAVVGEGGLAPDRGRPVGHQAGWLPRSGPRVIVVHLRQGLQVSGAATRDPRRVVGGRRCTAGRRASSCRRDRTWAQQPAAVHDRAVSGLDRHRRRRGPAVAGQPTDGLVQADLVMTPASPRTLKQLESRRLPTTAARPRTAG
jgi:hypothetical protein